MYVTAKDKTVWQVLIVILARAQRLCCADIHADSNAQISIPVIIATVNEKCDEPLVSRPCPMIPVDIIKRPYI